MAGQCSRKCPGNSPTVMPSIPGLPLLDFTRFRACKQFSRSQTSSISCSSIAGLSVLRFAVNDSVPPLADFGASLLFSSLRPAEAGCSAACRSSSRAAYWPLPSVWAFAACAATMPAADFCCTIRRDCSILSPDSGTCSRPPEVSSTAFNAQPPDLQPAPLMDMDFAITSPLVRHRMPRIWFLFIGSHLCSTLLSDHVSQRRPCVSLSLHLQQVVKRTFTSKLSNMLGTLVLRRRASRRLFTCTNKPNIRTAMLG